MTNISLSEQLLWEFAADNVNMVADYDDDVVANDMDTDDDDSDDANDVNIPHPPPAVGPALGHAGAVGGFPGFVGGGGGVGFFQGQAGQPHAFGTSI